MSDNADYIAISFDFSYYVVTGKGKRNLKDGVMVVVD
jgi:hypothetical protein